MTLPTREEINVYDSLDERVACENFLGKTLEEAEALFRENSIYYQEDLMWMGPIAFRYYVSAVIAYIQSEAAADDPGIISCFAGILEFRLQWLPAEELQPIASQLAASCAYVVENYAKFKDDTGVYGDPRGRFMALREALLSLPT